MITKKILAILVDHFNGEGWPFGINESKLYERSSVSSDPNRPGWYIVEIERHRAALSASYHKGQPMAAYETYLMKYAVHEKTGEVEELPEISDGIDIDDIDDLIDEALEEMVELSIDHIKKDKYRICDEINKYEEIISTYKETVTFALKVATKTADDYIGIVEGTMDISEDQLNQLKTYAPEYIKARFIDEVKRLWKDREISDDEV